MRSKHKNEIISHYESVWNTSSLIRKFNKGPISDLPDEFSVLEFSPTNMRKMWTYATCGMSQNSDYKKIELHIFSLKKEDSIVELLTAIAHYHVTGLKLDLWHTVNFGKGWIVGSDCDHGLISLPYLDGPELEILNLNNCTINFYWLIPITKRELKYKIENGVDALEDELEKNNFNYLDPFRDSVI